MGREVRRVPANWQHPKNERGHYIPMMPAGWFDSVYSDWKEENDPTWPEPTRDQFMPDWPDDQCTHMMMYEDTSEGTPISPAFSTAEELARWLADNNASALGDQTATYEQWLRMINGSGYAISAVMIGGKLISGVAAG